MSPRLRSVFKSDGSLHFENEIGTGTVRTRMDLSTGEVSTVISSGPINTVTSNNGSHFEYTAGNMRFNSETGTPDYLL